MTALRANLRERSEARFKEVEQLIDRVTPQLWHTYGTFPAGTKHTPEHTEMVEQIASHFVRDELLDSLNVDEIAMLLLACHYHDLGMSGSQEDNATAEGRDQVRREHAISIGNHIRDEWQTLGFPNSKMADVLGEICRGHRPARRDGVASWDDLPSDLILGPQRSVRVRLVSAIVYAADELHIGEDRAPRREEDFNKIVDPEAVRHWRRHQAITGPLMSKDEISFDGSVNTVAFEKDLRTSLKKAFNAVTELRGQLEREDLPANLPTIRLRWKRSALWNILIPAICSDLVPRSVQSIIEKVFNIYLEQMQHSVDLSGVCIEEGQDEGAMNQIQTSLNDLKTQGMLVAEEEEELLVYNISANRRGNTLSAQK